MSQQPPQIAASPKTRMIAEHIIRDTTDHGADATLKWLPEVHPTQVPALVHLLARRALEGGGPREQSWEELQVLHRRYSTGDRQPLVRRGEVDFKARRRAIRGQRADLVIVDETLPGIG